jgi:DNA repair photolyase
MGNPDRVEVTRDYREMVPWLAFERRILVKENAAVVLRKTLRQGSDRHAALINGESISIGTATDPYQPAERRFGVTRAILEVLADHPGLRVRIITKSPLVTRDIDVMKRILRHSSIHIHMSLITVDRELARRIEPRAPTPVARLRGIRRLRDAGIDVGVNVMPILPGITDAPEQLDALVRQAAASGATHLAACALRLQSAARKRYLPWIAEEFPHLAARYAATYARDFRAGESYRDGLTRVMTRICKRHGMPYGTYDDGSLPDAWAEQEAGTDALNQLELPLRGAPQQGASSTIR